MSRYKQTNLSKGTKLYYVKNNISKTTMVKITFECGSRCDTIPGLAHFTEHMFFSGTKTMTRDEVNKKYFDFINVNAATSPAEIYFDGNVFTKEFEEYVKTVGILITETTFSQKEINKECPIIQQEIARKKDKFGQLASSKNFLNITENKFYENYGALGTEESVATIKSKDIKVFVKKYFIANNLKVFVSSPLSLSKVKAIVEKNLVEKLEFNEKFEQLPYFVNYTKNLSFYNVETKDIGKNYLYINFNHPNNIFDFEFRAKYSLIMDMINDFSTGILKYIREEKHLVYGGSFSRTIRNDKEYTTTFSTECAKENVSKVIIAVSEYLNKIKKDGFTQEQLDKAKRLYKFDLDVKEPRVGANLYRLGDYVLYGKIIENVISKLAKKVTLEECNALFKEIFVNKNVSLTVFGNIKKEELISQERFNELFI